jgi:DNA-binding CsgD family transcriptional regulator
LRYGRDLTRQDVVKLTDAISFRGLAHTEFFQEYLQPNGERHEMFVPLPSVPGHIRNFIFCRWDRDFTEVDRDLLTLLRPHLAAVCRDHRRRRAGVPRLTSRQWEVLRCLAEGQTTEQVAAAMVVSVSTVRKHLENIYERLGVTSRAAAVAKALVYDADAVAPRRPAPGGPTAGRPSGN